MPLTRDDLCPGEPYGPEGHAPTHCSCGLPWDPDRGPHTRTGLVLRPDVPARILAREGERIEAEERREAVRAGDARRLAENGEAIIGSLRFVRRPR